MEGPEEEEGWRDEGNTASDESEEALRHGKNTDTEGESKSVERKRITEHQHGHTHTRSRTDSGPLNIIGRRVKVCFDDGVWYAGIVVKYNNWDKKFPAYTVYYDSDGSYISHTVDIDRSKFDSMRRFVFVDRTARSTAQPISSEGSCSGSRTRRSSSESATAGRSALINSSSGSGGGSSSTAR